MRFEICLLSFGTNGTDSMWRLFVCILHTTVTECTPRSVFHCEPPWASVQLRSTVSIFAGTTNY